MHGLHVLRKGLRSLLAARLLDRSIVGCRARCRFFGVTPGGGDLPRAKRLWRLFPGFLEGARLLAHRLARGLRLATFLRSLDHDRPRAEHPELGLHARSGRFQCTLRRGRRGDPRRRGLGARRALEARPAHSRVARLLARRRRTPSPLIRGRSLLVAAPGRGFRGAHRVGDEARTAVGAAREPKVPLFARTRFAASLLSRSDVFIAGWLGARRAVLRALGGAGAVLLSSKELGVSGRAGRPRSAHVEAASIGLLARRPRVEVLVGRQRLVDVEPPRILRVGAARRWRRRSRDGRLRVGNDRRLPDGRGDDRLPGRRRRVRTLRRTRPYAVRIGRRPKNRRRRGIVPAVVEFVVEARAPSLLFSARGIVDGLRVRRRLRVRGWHDSTSTNGLQRVLQHRPWSVSCHQLG